MSIQQEMHYKEIGPAQTVERLRGILADMGIELEENWMPESSIGTFSLRVNIKGTHMGTNGKGVTREFARASAFAEFFERYQNNFYDMCCMYSDDTIGFRHFHDEKLMNPFQIASLDNAFMNGFFARRGLQDASVPEKAQAINALDRNESYMPTGNREGREVRPYYNITKKRVEYLPFMLGLLHFGSNGMCAGNSPEEALAQGISEVLERYVQKKMITEKLCFPDIPEAYIKKFPYIYEMYQKAMGIPGYHFALKDCSLGGKIPVAALILTKQGTGMMGIKFGSHPDFGVAMERTFTEASQGADVVDYAIGCAVDFSNAGVDDEINIFNSFKFGTASYPYQVLGNKPDFAFAPVRDTSAMPNKEILKYMVGIVEDLGCEMWVRDMSYLGFPAYHVVVPGMSELFDLGDTHLRASNTRGYLVRYLNRPHLIDEKVCRYLVGALEFWSRSKIDNSMRNTYGFAPNAAFPGEEMGLGWLYMSAMGYVFLGEYKNAYLRMFNFIRDARIFYNCANQNIENGTASFYMAVFNYIAARANGLDHGGAMEYIRVLYAKETCARIEDIFSDPSRVFVKQYPDHDYTDAAHCKETGCCDYHAMLECSEKLKRKQLEHPIRQEDLKDLLK